MSVRLDIEVYFIFTGATLIFSCLAHLAGPTESLRDAMLAEIVVKRSPGPYRLPWTTRPARC